MVAGGGQLVGQRDQRAQAQGEAVAVVAEELGLVRRELNGDLPLLGFAGSPLTLAFFLANLLRRTGLAIFAFLLWVFPLELILRGILHGTHARRAFARFLAIGVATYFTFHVVVNVSITTGLLPVTGLPLPMISYGGSNLLTSSILLGLLLNVSSRTFDD